MNLLTIQSMRDGTRVREFVSYPTRDDALAALYYKMWTSVSDSDLVNVICELVGDDGVVSRRETYTRVVPDETAAPAEPLNKEG